MNNKLMSDFVFVTRFCICVGVGVESCTKHLQKQSSSLTGDTISEERIGKTVRGRKSIKSKQASTSEVACSRHEHIIDVRKETG